MGVLEQQLMTPPNDFQDPTSSFVTSPAGAGGVPFVTADH